MNDGRAVASAGDPYGIDALQAALTAALEARNADIVAMAREVTHAQVAEVFGVTRSFVSQQVRAADARAWGKAVPERSTYAQRIAQARHDWECIRHAAQLHAEERTGLHKTELREYAEGREGTARDDLPVTVPTWAEYRKTASVSATRATGT